MCEKYNFICKVGQIVKKPKKDSAVANQDASRGSHMPAPHLTGGVWRLVGSDGGRSTLGFGAFLRGYERVNGVIRV